MIELGTRLVDRSQTFFRFVGYELVLHHQQAMLSLSARRLERLGQGIDSWRAVDTLLASVGARLASRTGDGQVDSRLGPFNRSLVAARGIREHGTAEQQGPWRSG